MRERGDANAAAGAFLALLGIANPTPEQAAGAALLGHLATDLHLVARAHTKKE